MSRLALQFAEALVSGNPDPRVVERARRELERAAAARTRKLAKSRPSRKAKAAARAQVGQDRQVMHAEVWAWNLAHTRGPGAFHGRCDCGCGQAFRHATEGELDHWIELSQGGEDTRENGWRLTAECHWRKTNERPPPGNHEDSPARPLWNAAREAYCQRAGILFVPRRVK